MMGSMKFLPMVPDDVVCTQTLGKLCSELGPESVDEFIRQFKVLLPLRITRLNQALAFGDGTAGEDAALSLKSAATMAGAHGMEGPVVVVLSGGNVDTLLLNRVLVHGLVAAGRFMEMIVRVPDRPGSLVKLLAALARTECNVVSVEHDRTSTGLAATEVQIGVKVETKGQEHKVEIISELKRLKYDVAFPAAEKA